MGKGDKKSRKGKITKGTFGNRRPKKAQRAQTSKSTENKKEAAA